MGKRKKDIIISVRREPLPDDEAKKLSAEIDKFMSEHNLDVELAPLRKKLDEMNLWSDPDAKRLRKHLKRLIKRGGLSS